jgi:hypothetical protein
MEGDPSALQTIGTIAGMLHSFRHVENANHHAVCVTGITYTWVTNSTLVNANDYALMLSQNDTFSISTTFAIDGGAATSAKPTATLTPSSSASSTMSTSTTARSSTASSAAATATGAAGLEDKGDSPHEKLTTGGIVGVVIGIVALFIMFLALCVFAVATKKLGPDGPPPPEGAGLVEADDQTNLRAMHDDPEAGGMAMSMSEVAAGKQAYRKRSGSEGEGSQASNYSTSLSSPDTLVPTPVRRIELDDPGQSLNSSRAPSINGSPLRSHPANLQGMQAQMVTYDDGTQAPPPAIQGNWMHDDWVQRQAYAMPAPMSVPQGQARVVGLNPQFTGESTTSTLNSGPRSRSSSGASLNAPAPAQATSRRLSPTSPPVAPLGPSKLRTQFDVDEE